MRFGVLGSLEIRDDDGRLLVPNRRKQRILLATLLLRANSAVSNGSIADALWEDHPPASAAANLKSYIADLRRLLGGGEVGGAPRVRSSRGGYVLRVADGELDSDDFQRLTAEGREALRGGDPAVAAERLARALSQWRGRVLEGLAVPAALEAETARLEEMRLAVVEDSVEARLASGAPGDLSAELEALVRQHPLRERMWGQLMLALYRSGRQGDALAAFRRAADLLDRELGVPPGAALRQLYQMILAGDAALDPEPAGQPTAGIPRQLPADTRVFTGRARELAALDALLPLVGAGPVGTPVVVVVSGTAGVGKTALAVHWAHRVAGAFPDGQLYVDLRGFAPDGARIEPADALRGLLDALAVPERRMPAGLDAQAGLYRSLLADRRMLVVLDNASSIEQVRPLLPGTDSCAVIVTSRESLAGLVAANGAHPFALDVLSAAEAVEMLERRLGPARVSAEPAAAAQIVTACARLPLALAVAAARAQQTGFPLAALAAELSEVAQRLDLLDAGDPASQVRAVLSWSYAALPPPAARLFRLLGLHAGPDISAAAAASLAGLPRHRTRQLLAELTRASLLTEHRPGRYTFHDLLRAYATDLTHRHDPDPDRREALGRLIDHHTHTAHAATLLLGAFRAPITLPLAPPAPGTDPEHPANPREAMAWLTAEHPLLLATLQQAADAGFDTQAWQLAWSLHTFLDRAGHWSDLAKAWQAALAAAHRLDNPSAQALAHRDLARAHLRLGRYTEAEDHLHRALDVYTQAGDRVRQGHTHHNISYLWERQGRLDRALHHAQQALALHQDTGDHRGEAFALNAVGWHHALLGDHTQALTYCEAALLLLQHLGERAGEANTWDSLGYIHHHLAHHPQAVNCYQHALDLLRELGDRYEEAATLIRLGDTHHTAGDADAARRCWQQAAAILDELDHPDAADARARFRTPAPISNGQAPQPTPG